MSDKQILNYAKLIAQLTRFTYFVQQMDGGTEYISFRDSSGILGREEDYKRRVAEKAREKLNYAYWKEYDIGTGNIADCAKDAMNQATNLVNMHQQVDFKNRLDSTHPEYRPEAERVLFDIYCNRQIDEAEAFANAIKIFGAKYDTIAYLFFIKDGSRFLPIGTTHFDNSFSILGIDYTTSYSCSWENYQGFISIISEILSVMKDVLPMKGELELIDAHSFTWIIQEEKFQNWVPSKEQEAEIEQQAEETIQHLVTGTPGRRGPSVLNPYKRSAAVVKETKRRAKGTCQLCDQPAPFNDKNGEPYLEVHHIVWLSRGGEDSTDNTAALCPNCHTRMHVLDDPCDVEKLKKL